MSSLYNCEINEEIKLSVMKKLNYRLAWPKGKRNAII